MLESQFVFEKVMKKSIHIFIFLFLALSVQAQVVHQRFLLTGKYDEAYLQSSLKPLSQWNPFPGYDQRTDWNELPDEIKEFHLKAGDQALDYVFPSLPATLYLEYSRNGNRSNYQDIYFEKRTQLANLMVAELISAEGKYLDQIVNGLWSIMEESSWCIPAHISLQEDGGTPLPRHDENVVDLFAAETSSTLSWIYYFLQDELDEISPVITARMQEEVKTRVLEPVMQRDDFWWMGFGARKNVNNWNPWVISNWIASALIMEHDQEQKAKSIHRAMLALDNFLNIYPDDGGCDEGPGYWGHAGGSLFDCLEWLYLASDGKVDIYDEPLVKNIGAYIYKAYINDNYFINFADASAIIHPYADLIYRYGKRIEDPTMTGFAAFIAKDEDYADYNTNRWMGRAIAPVFSYQEVKNSPAKEPLLSDFWLPETQIFGARSEYNSNRGFYLAAKGGHNAESHNHNDVGNFIIYYNGKPLVIDIGVEEYTRKTFSGDRYDIWTMQSQYHSLPTVNSHMQINGREYCAEDLEFSSNRSKVSFQADIAGAYPEEAGIKSWNRSLELNRGKSVAISEEFELEKINGQTTFNLMTPYQVDVDENNGMITFNDPEFKVRLVFNHNDLDIETEEINVTDRRLKPVWGDKLYRIKLQLKNPQLSDKVRYMFIKG